MTLRHIQIQHSQYILRSNRTSFGTGYYLQIITEDQAYIQYMIYVCSSMSTIMCTIEGLVYNPRYILQFTDVCYRAELEASLCGLFSSIWSLQVVQLHLTRLHLVGHTHESLKTLGHEIRSIYSVISLQVVHC